MPAVASIAEFIDHLDLNLVYMGCVFMGVLYSAVLMMMGHLSDLGQGLLGDVVGGHHGGDGSGDGHGSVHVLFISPLGLTALVTGFGASGLITRNAVGLAPMTSVFVSAGVAIGLDFMVAYLLYSVFVKAQSSTVFQSSDLVGMEGEVIAPIPPAGVGQIAFTTAAGRQTAVARMEDSSGMECGGFVRVDRVIGNTAIVVPVDPMHGKGTPRQGD